MKNFKLVSIISFIALTLLAVFGCAKNNEVANNSSNENDGVEKQFIVGFDAEYPPYGYLSDDGKTYTGFDLELAEEVCKRTGMKFLAQPIDWDSKDMELNAGNIDCIWNGFTINGRENDYTWSFPYVDNSIVLVVNADSGIKDKKDLAGKTVVVQAGSSGLSALTDEENTENIELVKTFKKLEQVPDYNTAFMNLEAGIADCVAVDIGVARYNLNNSNGKFVMLKDTVSSEQYAIGFKKGNTELRNIVEITLSDMWKDGTVQKIAEKYADYSLPDTLCLSQYVE